MGDDAGNGADDILPGMTMRIRLVLSALAVAGTITGAGAQSPTSQAAIEAETLQHFQALLKLDTQSPPGNETRAVEYLKQVLDKEGIPYQVFAKDPQRANLVARIKGNGKKRPILLMGHTDVVTVDEKKWTFPPFGAVRDGGYVYGRGAVDDKDNLAAALMTDPRLKRDGTPLDRDVILLAEAGEEGAPDVGAQFMADNHLDAINAEFCLAEGGGVVRARRPGACRPTSAPPRRNRASIEIIARGPAGHGSVPSRNNAVTHAVGRGRQGRRLGRRRCASTKPPAPTSRSWRPWCRPTSRRCIATCSAPIRRCRRPAADWLLDNQPTHWSMLHTSLVPTIVDAGFRYNVIPSEAKATVRRAPASGRGSGRRSSTRSARSSTTRASKCAGGASAIARPAARGIDTEAFATLEAQLKKHYNTVVLPTMGTGATDMSNIRAKGIQCYGIGPAIDTEDGPKGFGAHSDQERILESELHRFVRFNTTSCIELARAK